MKEKPGVNVAQCMDPLNGHPIAKGLPDHEKPFRVGIDKPCFHFLKIEGVFMDFRSVRPQAVPTDLQGPDCLLKGFLEGPPDGHGLSDRSHGGGQSVLSTGELLKGPTGDLDHTVVDGGLKGGKGLPGNIVGDLVQGVSYCELGSDFCDGKSGGL